jgi:hypothetical protein
LYFLVPVTSMPAQFAWAVTLSFAFPMLLWAAGFLNPGEHALAARLLGQAANLVPGALRR